MALWPAEMGKTLPQKCQAGWFPWGAHTGALRVTCGQWMVCPSRLIINTMVWNGKHRNWPEEIRWNLKLFFPLKSQKRKLEKKNSWGVNKKVRWRLHHRYDYQRSWKTVKRPVQSCDTSDTPAGLMGEQTDTGLLPLFWFSGYASAPFRWH